MAWIERNQYLDWLVEWKDKRVIKVVSGVRRCGKSTLFTIFCEHIMKSGVERNQIIDLNFESLDYEHLTNYRVLYDYVNARLDPDRMNYIFLDEIQHVEHFEKAVDSLFIKENVDVYVTGSNAYFMSGELATLLSGRYVELKMLPLSFKEFCTAENNKGIPRNRLFSQYIEKGSFPFISDFQLDEQQTKAYLRDLYNTILLNDVVARIKVTDVPTLENVSKFLLHNIGSKVSLRKIADTLKSNGQSVDVKTVGKYLKGLTESLVLYSAPRYNVRGRQLLSTHGKYYAVDIGLRNALVKGQASDIGHVLENVVYLELLRRGYDVYVGDLDNGEVDFVAIKSNDTLYFQVAATTLEESTLKRELAPFRRITDNYPKMLLTLDELFGTADYGGIQKKNVLDWLLD
ncbi:ATP-binding protein [Raoultibacter phocaeensis]|uniref:ATP-binding protein n=1 Tax=Raoultibacter phocaeensis TaxID=2479841 RepID=UPI00111A6B36|nr:ATP-binding protein [Raoultibacter phocaeensis]